MKKLLIYSHSNPKNFTRAVLDSIQNSLNEISENGTVIDLYMPIILTQSLQWMMIIEEEIFIRMNIL